ncbi:MAG TPA: cyclodeaminase/cyclohydrolase family protein, partial [Thermoleophilia bacterium]|nr:cyclodeaminase/cyclohydrolase family protein [Thermoleophilia bacterium]
MEQQTRELLERIASDSPVPGGGSVSALAGALGASLGAMVSRLTAAKQAGTMRGGRAGELVGDLDRARERLADSFGRDAASYEGVIAAYRLPKGTEQEQRARKEAVQAAM